MYIISYVIMRPFTCFTHCQDDITGDGTTSNVLIIGELLKQSDLYISEGLHPRILSEGFEKARTKALEVGIIVGNRVQGMYNMCCQGF